jgi:hypothetical protein
VKYSIQSVASPSKPAIKYRVPKQLSAALRAVTGGTHGVAEFNGLADQLGKTEKQYLGSPYPPALAHYRQPELFPTVAPQEQWEEILTWGNAVAEVATFATGTEYTPALRAHAVTVSELVTGNWVQGQAAFQAAVKARDGAVLFPRVVLETTLGAVEWTEAGNTMTWHHDIHAAVLAEIRDLATSVG